MRVILGILFSVLLLWPFEASAQASNCRDMDLGSFQFTEINGVPLKVKFDTCLDGTAWATIFRFSGKLKGTLEEVQKTVDAVINTKTDTCKDRDYAVKVSNVKVAMEKPEANIHRAKMTMDAEVKRCSFPNITVRLQTIIPVTLNNKNIDLTIQDPTVTVTSAPFGADRFIPALRQYIIGEAKEQIQPYLKSINDLEIVSEDLRKLLRPSVKSISLISSGDRINFNFELIGGVEKQRFQQPLNDWLKTSGLK